MDREALNEFQRIRRFYAPLAGPGGLGLLDDAALVDCPSGRQPPSDRWPKAPRGCG